MGFEIRRFSVAQQPMARGAAQQGEAQAAESPVMQSDQATFASRAAAEETPDYPTVGEYVKQQFDEKMNSALTGLHLVAEALPPVLVAEIAAIHLKHKRAALKEIWSLPMDPQGKWKVKAQQIMDAHAKVASQEVGGLPLVRALHRVGDAIGDGARAVGRGFSWLGDTIVSGVRSGFQSAGRLITHGANYVLDGFVSTGVAIGKGVQAAGMAIENGSRAAGTAIRNAGTTIAQGASQAYDATVSGITWIGTQAVELPKAAARGVLHGIGDVGQDLVDFSNKAEPLFAPAN